MKTQCTTNRGITITSELGIATTLIVFARTIKPETVDPPGAPLRDTCKVTYLTHKNKESDEAEMRKHTK